MSNALEAIVQRRAVKVFDPIEIPAETRDQILHAARLAPSSFNIQPYRFYWVTTPEIRSTAAKLCFGQSPAATASVLVVAVADIGSWKSTTAGELAWMRTAGFTEKKIAEYKRRAKFGKWFFIQGWFGIFGAIKWIILRLLHIWKTGGTLPVARQGMFKWATKSAALACQNLMIAAQALGLNTCPMEGFDSRRLAKLLKLSRKNHEIVMVIAIGKKSALHEDRPQWRRPLAETVHVL
ncbi:MAG: nitroreductase family protein [Candidatus Acidiferrales bacterium]